MRGDDDGVGAELICQVAHGPFLDSSTWIRFPFHATTRNLKPVYRLNTGGGAAKYGIFVVFPLFLPTPPRPDDALSPVDGNHMDQHRIYAKYEICGPYID